MMPANPFLAEPIRAVVTNDGILHSADPDFMRLHENAGGRERGTLAVPALLALAEMTGRTGMRIERPVRVADLDDTIDLWVAAAPHQNGIELTILGWQELAERITTLPTDAISTDGNILILDASLLIARAPLWLEQAESGSLIGNHVAKLLSPVEAKASDLPMIDVLAERKPVCEMSVTVGRESVLCALTLSPEFSKAGTFLGYTGLLKRSDREHSVVASPAFELTAPQSGFGAQLAPILRQPIDRIIANAETISGRLIGPLRENYAGYAQDIANAARHLAALVSDMEDLAAIDHPDFVVARDEIELGDIARRVAGLLALKAADHQIRIVSPLETGIRVDAIAEFRRVLQILLNLVGNAIRYSPDGTEISISIWTDGDRACASVSDQGYGIEIKDRERIFEKFERLGRSGDGGSGLGLYISRKLARAMGGELIATAANGGGAQFVLSLPRTPTV
jgi:nitrogen-specific signal transduction histidine kinase